MASRFRLLESRFGEWPFSPLGADRGCWRLFERLTNEPEDADPRSICKASEDHSRNIHNLDSKYYPQGCFTQASFRFWTLDWLFFPKEHLLLIYPQSRSWSRLNCFKLVLIFACNLQGNLQIGNKLEACPSVYKRNWPPNVHDAIHTLLNTLDSF